MADSTTPVPQLSSGQSQKEVTANGNFDMSSPAMLYGRNPLTTTGLTWGYLGGRLDSASVANGTVALTDNATNYVVALISTAAVSVSTATTNWNNAGVYLRLYKVTTVSGAVTAYEDHRSVLGLPPTVSGFTGGTMTSAINEAPITTLASASTVNIGAELANTISITGTTTITAFDTIASGAIRRLIFAGALILTHNGTSLILPTAANITTAAGDVAEFVSEGSGNWRCTNFQRKDGTALSASSGMAREWQIACSDLTTALTTGTGKAYGRAPRAMTITGVRASLYTAQTSGSIFTVDINEGGTTILSTKLTIDNTEKTSTTAATAAVVSDTAIADDAEITIDIDQVGDGTAVGLIVTILYT